MNIYTITVFTSAFLLLMVQPMLARLMLPELGGSPAVWNTAMMFFQTILLLGYAYAHGISEFLHSRRQALVHTSLALCTLLWLPLSLHSDLDFSSSQQPMRWVLTCLALTIGVPFFLMSANAPLLQSWFAKQPQTGKNPYRLYSVSSAGSLIALLCYPLVVEPLLQLPQQTTVWSGLYIAYIMLLLGCAWRQYRAPLSAAAFTTRNVEPKDYGWRRRLYWLVLALVPSSLLQGVTTHITTDIASMPLFWVMPLSLYLLTFVFAFHDQSRSVNWALKAQLWVMPLAILTIGMGGLPFYFSMSAHLLMFYVITLVCHGTLYRARPGAAHLTEFYLWLSLGGMLGGVFNSLLAPLLFKTPLEYLLALAWAAMLRPAMAKENTRLKNLITLAVFGIGLVLVANFYRQFAPPPSGGSLGNWLSGKPADATAMVTPFSAYIKWLALSIAFVVSWMAALRLRHSPLGFTVLVAVLLMAGPQLFRSQNTQNWDMSPQATMRNFFGVKRVVESKALEVTLFMQGTTLHGIQGHREEERLVPRAYYGALRQLYEAIPAATRQKNVAVLGLGAGTLACYGEAGQRYDLYEIDPQVVDVAQNPDFFTYMRDCKPEKRIILGDGRLKMQEAADGEYGMIVVDVFSSDSIPIHLLTSEAIGIYASKLAPGGVMAFNVSNRHLHLAPVMAALAEQNQLVAYQKNFKVDYSQRLTLPSQWIVMARQESDFGSLLNGDSGWKKLSAAPGQKPWTDHYSNILETLIH